MSITYYSASRIMNKLMNNAVLTQPSSYYLALSSTLPAIDGSNITEPVSLGYARVVSPSDSSTWSTSTTNTLSNLIAFTFPESTGSWGTMGWFVLFDALTSGNAWFFGALSPSVAVAANTEVRFAAGSLVVTMTN